MDNGFFFGFDIKHAHVEASKGVYVQSETGLRATFNVHRSEKNCWCLHNPKCYQCIKHNHCEMHVNTLFYFKLL